MDNNLKLFSETEIVNAFTNKLTDLIKLKHLGTYILCLANALTDKRLYKAIQPNLHTALAQLKANQPDAPEDDIAVFKKLIDSNLSFPKVAQNKKVGPWLVQYNQIRSYRPARNANEKITSIFKDFNEQGFHFNKPFLQKEMLQSITFKGNQINCFLNKFPFTQNHLLLLINPKNELPQLLSKTTLQLIYQLSLTIKTCEHSYFSYNSIGAYASVNHLHFHFTSLPYTLPISNPIWQHNGGKQHYPVNVLCFNNANDCWAKIKTYHEANQAYNLIIEGKTLYLIPRAFQETIKHDSWIQNIAWFELAGVMTVANENTYKSFTKQMISTELSKIKVAL